MNTKKKIAIELLDQIIEEANGQDIKFKQQCISQGKSSDAQGESFMVFHLKALKNLVEGI
jgi:hypothetical protein